MKIKKFEVWLKFNESKVSKYDTNKYIQLNVLQRNGYSIGIRIIRFFWLNVIYTLNTVFVITIPVHLEDVGYMSRSVAFLLSFQAL